MGLKKGRLENDDVYRRWRDCKLERLAMSDPTKVVEIAHPPGLTAAEKVELVTGCQRHNFCLYAMSKTPTGDVRDAVLALGQALGLQRLDPPGGTDTHPVATVRVEPDMPRPEYIPYTNKSINWHTDGYYNPASQRIRGMLMHCVQTADSGGANSFLDPDLVYIKLRNEDPDLVRALMCSDAMSISANIYGGVVLRPERPGPVFSFDETRLHMRYTARTRSVRWSDEPTTRRAAKRLLALLGTFGDDCAELRLGPGQGIVCNNVLHRREAFTQSCDPAKQRILLRARYHDRVAGT